ncbi:MAG TPA: hypothetical protein DG048_24815 [Pseudoalteromonas sp.]|nr:hypothetical protein [Pseudoalteromonas sp.]
MPDLMPSVSVGTKVIPFPVLYDWSESKNAPEAIEKSHINALDSSYVLPPSSWNKRKVAALPVVLATKSLVISVLTTAVYKAAAVVLESLAWPNRLPGA